MLPFSKFKVVEDETGIGLVFLMVGAEFSNNLVRLAKLSVFSIEMGVSLTGLSETLGKFLRTVESEVSFLMGVIMKKVGWKRIFQC